jgi:hypothetical protein
VSSRVDFHHRWGFLFISSTYRRMVSAQPWLPPRPRGTDVVSDLPRKRPQAIRHQARVECRARLRGQSSNFAVDHETAPDRLCAASRGYQCQMQRTHRALAEAYIKRLMNLAISHMAMVFGKKDFLLDSLLWLLLQYIPLLNYSFTLQMLTPIDCFPSSVPIQIRRGD